MYFFFSQYILYYKQMYECREIQVKNVTRDYKPALESRAKSVNVKRNNVYYMSRPALPTKQQTPSS